MDRRTFIAGAAAGALALTLRRRGARAPPDLKAVHTVVERQAGEALARLRDWIRQPSVNAQNIGMKEGCELMMRLARDAGFTRVERVPTDGASAVFAE